MTTRRRLLVGSALGAATALSFYRWPSTAGAGEAPGSFAVSHTEAEWRKRLTPDQFAVLRHSGTERPFTSPLLEEHRRGTFACAGCGQDDFSSDTKFESVSPCILPVLPLVFARADRPFARSGLPTLAGIASTPATSTSRPAPGRTASPCGSA